MKILVPGTATSWSRNMTCTGDGNGGGGCGAQLLVEAGDVFITAHHSYGDDDPTHFHTFQCPQCSVLTDFSYHTPLKNLPTFRLWQKLKGR